MRKERVAARGNHALHGVGLVRFQAPSGAQAVDGELAAVVFRRHQGVEGLVVKVFQVLCPLFVLPQPLLELRLDFLHLGVGRRRRHGIDVALALRVLAADGDAAAVQHGVQQVQEAARARAPLLRVQVIALQALVFELHGEIARLVRAVDHDIRPAVAAVIVPADHRRGKIGVYVVRDPGRARLYKDRLVRHVRGHHLFERVNVVLIVLVDADKALRLAQLGPHVPGKVDLRRQQVPVAVLERLLAVDQLPRHVRGAPAGQPGDQRHVDPAGRVPADDHALRHAVHVRDGAVRPDRILLENVRLGRGFLLAVPIFQRVQAETVRVVGKGFPVGL